MTSKQLAHTVCKAVTRRDLSDVPLDASVELLDALNLVLAKWLLGLPRDRRTTTFGCVCRAPVTQTVDIIHAAKGFAYVNQPPYPAGGFASEAAALGATALISGDGTRNQLQAPGELLYPYGGPTNPAASLTLYGDAVHLPPETWQVEGEVELAPASSDTWRDKILRHNPARQHDRGEGTASGGEPQEWWMEPLQTLEETDSRRYVLRVWPLPASTFTLRLVISRFPAAFTMEDLFESRSLPFEALEGSLFTTACRGAFAISSTHRAEGVDAAALTTVGADAMQQLVQMQRPLTSQPGFVGTPPGF